MSDGTSIFDLDPESFRIYFEEGRRDRSPEQNEFLLQEYRRRSSPLSELYERAPKTPPGRRRLGILPMTVPEGMTGMEAIRSGEFEFGYPGALTEMSDTLRDVIDMPGATLRGPVSATELTETAPGAGELLALGMYAGPVRSALNRSARGRVAPEPPAEASFRLDDTDFFGDEVWDDVYPPPPASNRSLLASEDVTPFFSTVQRALQNLPQEKYGDTGQFLAALERAGAKPAEIDAMGLKSLAFDGGPISRSEFAEQLDSRIRNEGLGDVRILNGSGEYLQHFPAERTPSNYRERVIALPASEYPQFTEGANLLGDRPAIGSSGDAYEPPHFGNLVEESGVVPIMHYRTGIFETDDGLRTLHVGEIQSDIVQGQRKQAKNRKILDENRELFEAYEREFNDAIDAGLDPEDSTGWEAVEAAQQRLATRLFEKYNMGRQETMDFIHDVSLWNLDYGGTPSTKLPVAGTTDKFTQLGVRGALMDALEADVDYVTFPFPDEVERATGGDIKGHTEYYGKILPKNIRTVLKDIEKRSGVKMPDISTDISTSRINSESMGPESAPFRFGIRLTPEVKDAIRKAGMPLYRDGGVVSPR